MISAVAETSGASIDEVKFHYYFFKVTKFSKEWKICPKTHFIVFALVVGNISNKHHYNLLKILRIFSFWYFCPKWLFPKLFVFKFDLCIKVVALIKITTMCECWIKIGSDNTKEGWLKKKVFVRWLIHYFIFSRVRDTQSTIVFTMTILRTLQ